MEACQSFKLKYAEGRPRLTSTTPRCLCLYFYFIDREFSMMHLRLQTWFPFTVQIYLNGHDWLARKMTRHGIGYEQVENAFIRIDECRRAQRFADRFANKQFPRILEALARKANPLLKDLLHGMKHYWVVDQAQFATDILFKDRAALSGEHFIHGFRNRDIAEHLRIRICKQPLERKRQSARVTRFIQLLHAHHLIAKIPRSRRYRLTIRGATLMSAAVYLYNQDFHSLIKGNAA